MSLVAALIGYLVGSLPSADWAGRAAGHDLRRTGTRNPGTANAIGLGGLRLGLTILALDFAKGAAAVAAGRALAGDAAGVAAGLTAVAAQIANPWYGFRGGKGLGVTGGAALVAWPLGFAALGPLLVAASRALGASARGVLVALAATTPAAALWAAAGWPNLWGLEPGAALVWFAIGLTLLVAPKFVRDTVAAGRARPAPARRAT